MLNYFNNIANIFQVAPALTGKTYNFTPQNHQINRKAPASPPTPQRRAEQIERGTRQSEGKRGRGESAWREGGCFN